LLLLLLLLLMMSRLGMPNRSVLCLGLGHDVRDQSHLFDHLLLHFFHLFLQLFPLGALLVQCLAQFFCLPLQRSQSKLQSCVLDLADLSAALHNQEKESDKENDENEHGC
jgi:predicted esterase